MNKTVKRRLRPRAEKTLRVIRGVAISVRVVGFFWILTMGLMIDPTWFGCWTSCIMALMLHLWTNVHEWCNELLQIDTYPEMISEEE